MDLTGMEVVSDDSFGDTIIAELMKKTKEVVTTCLSRQDNGDFGVFKKMGVEVCLTPAAAFFIKFRKEQEQTEGRRLPQSSFDILDAGVRTLLCAKTALDDAVSREDFGSKSAQCGA